MELRFEGTTVALNGKTLVDRLGLTAGSGQVTGLVGPNGSGKSTALRCVYGALKPTGGAVWLGEETVAELGNRRAAQVIAALTQESSSEFDFTVAELVELGRFPHLTGNQALTTREKDLCRDAMERLDVAHLADRGVLTLSGGERQRVLIARALVQEPAVLVLDEPTNHLDVRHQIELLSLLRTLGLTVLVVLHDLNLAAAVCDRIGVLSDGSLVRAGTPAEVLTAELVREVFGVEVTVVDHPLTGDPQLLYALTSDRRSSV